MPITVTRTFMFVCLLALGAASATADVPSRVFLNGVPTPVYFNDGDSFRVLGGPLKGTKARLAGFNTLESYGRAHQWGSWTREELSRFAYLGTMNARRGVWRCTTPDMKRDGYGRILWHCIDLAVDQVKKGLAHVMTVTAEGGHPDVVAAQADAIKHRRGMWAHGVPDFVITSLHSADEGYRGTYNRLISSADGHSEKWTHSTVYEECQTACQPSDDVDRAAVTAYIAELHQDPKLAGVTAAMVGDYVTLGIIPTYEGDRYQMELVVTRAITSGQLRTSRKPVSCMVYAPFQRRYGASKASCLK